MKPSRFPGFVPVLLILFSALSTGTAAQDVGIVEKLYENAVQLLRNGKTEEALKGFQQIYDTYGSTSQAPDALYQAASYHYPVLDLNDLGIATRDQVQKALPLFDRIRTRYGTSSRAPEALYKLGLLALEPDNPKFSPNEAYAAFTSVATVYPDSPLTGDALYGAAVSQMRSGAYDVALEDFSRLLEQVPTFEGTPGARLAFGYAQYRAGDFPRAMEEYQKVRELFPRRSESLVALERLTLLHRLRLLPATGRAVSYGADASYVGSLDSLGLRSVSALGLGPDGTLLVADGKQGQAVTVDPRGHAVGKFPFPSAQAAAIDRRGGLLVAGAGNVLMNGKQQPLNRPDASSAKPMRDTPGMAVDRDGRIYVVDGKSGELLVYGKTLDFRSSVFRSAGGALGDVKIGFDNQVYLLDTRDKSITVLAEGKTKTRILLSEPPVSLVQPVDFAVDELGDLYVCDAGSGKVVVLDPTGKIILATLGGDRSKGGIAAPERIEVDRQGRIYVYDRKADAILRFR